MLRLWLAVAVPRVFCLWVSASEEGPWLLAVAVGARARFCSSCLVGCGLGIAGMLVRELDACGKCCFFPPLVSLRVERGEAQQEGGRLLHLLLLVAGASHV